MPQTRRQKYNPVTRKYEWVVENTPSANRLEKPKNPEHQQIISWLQKFDQSVGKPKRTSDDYSFLIRRHQGVDVTPTVLNEAKSAGFLDDASYRKRLKQYQDVRAELGKTPAITKDGTPATYVDSVTGKEKPLYRSYWIEDGTFNNNQTFGDVASKLNKKRQSLVEQQKNLKAPYEPWEAAKHLYRQASGVINRNTVRDTSVGLYKNFVNTAADIVGAAEKVEQAHGNSLIDWTGSGDKLDPNLFRMARASVVNAFDDDRTPEAQARKIGRLVSGNVDPLSKSEAVGMQAGNFGGLTMAGELQSTLIAQSLGPEVGVPVAIANGLHMAGMGIGAGLEYLTGDPRWNMLGNPFGAVRKFGGEYNEPSESAMRTSYEEAPATAPLMIAAGLMASIALKKPTLDTGSYKQGLKTSVDQIKAVQSAATSRAAVNEITTGAKGMGLTVGKAPKPTAESVLRNATPYAMMGAANLVVPALQTAYHIKDPENNPLPSAADVISNAAMMLQGAAHPDSLVGRLNAGRHEFVRDAQIKYAVNAQRVKNLNELFTKAPVLKHISETYGLTSEQALAYVSHELDQAAPGALLSSNVDKAAEVINQLPTALKLNQVKETGVFEPVVDTKILNDIEGGQHLAISRMMQQEERRGLLAGRPAPKPANVFEQINPGLRGFTRTGADILTRRALLMARKTPLPIPVTPESAAEQMEANKRTVPLASMVIDTDSGPRKILYSHDLEHVFSTDDLEMPTHELHPDSYELKVGHLPKENILRGIAHMNQRANSNIEWSYQVPKEGTIYKYKVVGFGNGRLVVTKSNNNVYTLMEITPRELEMTLPENKKEQVQKYIDEQAREFGTNVAQDGEGTAVNYTRTDFRSADRDLFPLTIFKGRSTRGNRGVLPARKVAQTSAFNAYQLPNGTVIKIARISDTPENTSAPVMPPVDARMETVIGSRYAGDLYTQARTKDHPHYYDVTMPDNTEKKIYVTAKQQKKLAEMANEAAEKLSMAETTGEDRAFILNKVNGDLLNYLDRINSPGKPDDSVITYNEHHQNQPIREGDVVAFTDYVNEENKTRPSTLARAGHEKGVVVKVDRHGVHVKLANELPGLIREEGGRTVIVHPDNLAPIIQPHLNPSEIVPIKNVGDIETHYAKLNGEPLPEPSATDTTEGLTVEEPVVKTKPIAYDPDVAENIYGPEQTRVLTRLSEEGTVEHVRKTLIDVAHDESITPETLSRGLVNLLNDDYVSDTHKETILHAMLSVDLDPITNLNVLSKINHALDGVSSWLLSENRPVNLVDDASTLLSGDFADLRLTPKDIQGHAVRILHTWSQQNLDRALQTYFKRNPNIGEGEKAAITRAASAMALTIPRLRTYLNGRGLINLEAWSRIAKLSPEDQAKFLDSALQLQGTGRDTAKATSEFTLSNVMDIMDYARVSSTTSRIPFPKRILRSSYENMIKSDINRFKERIANTGTALAVKEINKPNGEGNISDVNAFLKTLSPESNSGLRDAIFKELEKQDIDKSTFNTLFQNIKFPGSQITIGEIADHVRNRTLDQFINASNELHASAVMLHNVEGATIDDFLELINPFQQVVPEDVYFDMVDHMTNAFDSYASRESTGATASEKRVSFLDSLNAAISMGLRNVGKNLNVADAMSENSKALYIKLTNRTMRALELGTTRAQAQARAAELTGGSRQPIININRASAAEFKSAFFDLSVDNIVQHTPPALMTETELKALRQAHEANNAWIGEQGKSVRLTDVPVVFPFVDVPNVGAISESGGAVEVSGAVGFNKEGLAASFKRAMRVSNKSSEDVKAVVDQLAQAYADAYDLHAYAYAARHAEYEFSVGNIEDANASILSTLEYFKQVATTPERKQGLDTLIQMVKNNEPLFIKNITGRSAYNQILDVFHNDVEFGQRLSTYLYTNRIATLQRDFYKDNGRLIITALDSNEATGPLTTSFGSLTYGTLNPNGNRARVNLLLHLNRTNNRSRDVLTIGHELHHGMYHTMPLQTKLLYAKNVIDAVAKAHGLDETSPTTNKGNATDIVNVRAELAKEIDRINKVKSQLKELIAQDPSNLELRDRYDKFVYETEIDMHADTSHILYTNPLINELVVSSLITGSMGMKPLVDQANYGIAYTSSGILQKMGAFVTQAVQLMNRTGDRSFAADYSVKATNQSVINASHNWKLRFNNSFVVKNAAGKPVAFGRLPKNTTVSFIVNSRNGLPVFPTFSVQGDTVQQLQAGIPNTQLESVPPQVKKQGTESHSLSVQGNYVSFKDGSVSSSRLKQKGKNPSFTLNGVEYWALDNVDGVFVDSVQQRTIRAQDIKSIVYGLVDPVSKSTNKLSIVTPEQLYAMNNVRVTGRTEGWNSTLSGLMYDLYARNNVIQISGMGQGDYAAFNALKRRIASIGLNLDAMPSVNMSTFDKGNEAYSGTVEGKSASRAVLDASPSVQLNSWKTRQELMEFLDQFSPDEQVQKATTYGETIDALRRTVFSLDPDNNPLFARYIDENGRSQTKYVPSLLTSEEGNTRALSGMFTVGASGELTPALRVVKDVTGQVLRLSEPEQQKFAQAVLNSADADKFESNLIAALGDDVASNILENLLDMKDRVSAESNVDISLNDVLAPIRELTAGSVNALLHSSDINAATLQSMYGRLHTRNSQWTPNINAQRDLILVALRASAVQQKRSVADTLEMITKEPAGREAANFLATANAIAIDIGNRSAAMRSYGQWELAGVKYLTQKKAPFLILRNKGTENRYSADLPITDAQSAYVAIDQETSVVRPAVPVFEKGVITGWTVVTNAVAPEAGISGVFDKSRFPLSPAKKLDQVNWSMTDETTGGNKNKDSYEISGEWLDTDLFEATANVNAHALQYIKNVIEDGLSQRVKGTRTYEATLPFYIPTGADPTNRFNSSLKPKNMLELFGLTNDYANGASVPDGSLQLRHVKLSMEYSPSSSKSDAGSRHIFTFTDYGPIHSSDVNRRTLGSYGDIPGVPIAPFEAYVARQLIDIEAVKDLNKQDNFFNSYDENGEAIPNFTQTGVQEPISRPRVITNPDSGNVSLQTAKTWKEWKGNSAFSDGYDADDFAHSIHEPLNQTDETIAQDSDSGGVHVDHDPKLNPDQIAIDVDANGVTQVRGGMNKLGWHEAGTWAAHAVNEIDGFFRTIKLAGDLSVANNQSWLLSNFLVAAEHGMWARKNGLDPRMARGPLFSALGAWRTMLPNAPGHLYGLLKNKGIPNTRFGDHMAHMHIEDILSRVPELSIDEMSHYGLNLEYGKWFKEYQSAAQQNPDIPKTDIPLNLRLSDYYGDAKYSQKLIPFVSPVERYNALWKDIAAITEFQKRYLEIQAMLPPEHMISGIEGYRNKELYDSAEAINLMQGMQRGSVSPNKYLAFTQRVFNKWFTSLNYRKSRLLLTPIIGRLIYQSKLGLNAASNAIAKRDIANVGIETKIFNDSNNGGFTPDTKAYIRRRLILGFVASRANQAFWSGSAIAATLALLFNADPEKKRQGVKLITDWAVSEAGLTPTMRIDMGEHKYQAPMPGGMSAGIKQINKLKSPTPSSLMQLPQWMWQQYLENQFGPTVQAAKTANEGKTFLNDNAWETDPNWATWRNEAAKKFPLAGLLPPRLSRFVVSLLPIGLTDQLKDIDLTREGNFARGNKNVEPENIPVDYYKLLTNMFGAGLTKRDDEYTDWLLQQVPEANISRYNLMKARKENAPSHSIVEEYKQHGMRGILAGNEPEEQ